MSLEITNFEDRQVVNTKLAVVKGKFPYLGHRCACVKNYSFSLENAESKGTATKANIPLTTESLGRNFVTICEALCPGPNYLWLEVHQKEGHNCQVTHLQHEPQRCFTLNYVPIQNEAVVQPLLVFSSFSPDQNRKRDPRGPVSDDRIDKIRAALKLVQAFYSEKIREAGFDRKSFRLLEKPEFAKLAYMELDGLNFSCMLTAEQAWRVIGKQLVQAQGFNRSYKYVAFVMDQTTIQGPPAWTPKVLHSPLAMGAGSLAVIPYSVTETWPQEVKSVFTIMGDKRSKLDWFFGMKGEYATVRNVYSASMGCLAHEIGHLFDLGHSSEGLMGENFDQFLTTFIPTSSSKNIESMLRMLPQNSPSLPPRTKPSFVKRRDDESTNILCDLSRTEAAILYFHRGFQPSPLNFIRCGDDLSITSNKIILARQGLAVVDIREDFTKKSLVLQNPCLHWLASPAAKKYPITRQGIPNDVNAVEVFAMDYFGSVLKVSIKVVDLPASSFTVLSGSR